MQHNSCCIKHDVKRKVHQVQRKQIDNHKVCSKCPPLAQTQARRRDGHGSTASSAIAPGCITQLRSRPLPVRRSREPVSCNFLFLFIYSSYQEIPESVAKHRSLLILSKILDPPLLREVRFRQGYQNAKVVEGWDTSSRKC